MNKNIEKREEPDSGAFATKKNAGKNWEDELSKWMIEEFYSPYQAS